MREGSCAVRKRMTTALTTLSMMSEILFDNYYVRSVHLQRHKKYIFNKSIPMSVKFEGTFVKVIRKFPENRRIFRESSEKISGKFSLSK